MSQPDNRSATGPGDAPHGSTASTGQPLADQPTEVVHRPEPEADWQSRQETVVVGPPVGSGAAPAAPAPWLLDDEAAGGRHADLDDERTTTPEHRDAPVRVRCADNVAGLLLLLAGIAAGVSLLLVWVNGGDTGLDLVRDGFDDLADDPQGLVDRDTWQPLAVALGGAALFVLGLLVFVPAKTHRFFGALALLVSLVVAAAVLVPLADANWDLERWAVGAWFTAAVAVLGFLGALKALMTGPRHR
ncbi:hypothetical protein [Modestobacter italicus]|uniref:hypothetical protein n=1 Tax=Modestobacter italicus (strain DSM 44449 / CECT 9708 / BC 501) TaxID=2732864 RepID=UPI001C981577|nr:hypothetical protein [Modestobacter italicus]